MCELPINVLIVPVFQSFCTPPTSIDYYPPIFEPAPVKFRNIDPCSFKAASVSLILLALSFSCSGCIVVARSGTSFISIYAPDLYSGLSEGM